MVENFFTYLSELHVFDESVIILESIKEIICPKTELPKKRIVLFIVECIFSEPNELKKKKEDESLPSLKALSDHNEKKQKNNNYLIFLLTKSKKKYYQEFN